MVDQEDEDMKMAQRENTQQHESPEPKRSKPRDNSGAGGEASQPEEAPEAVQRRTQRELMASAAEKRMAAAKSTGVVAAKSVVESGKGETSEEKRLEERNSDAAMTVKNVESTRDVKVQDMEGNSRGKGVILEKIQCTSGIADPSLSVLEAEELFLMIFGNRVTKDVLAQWTNQGIR